MSRLQENTPKFQNFPGDLPPDPPSIACLRHATCRRHVSPKFCPPSPLIYTFPRLCSAPSDCAPKHPLGGGASCGASLALSCSVRMREDASQCLSSEIHVCIWRLHRRPRGLQEARRLWEKGEVCNWLNKSRETEFPSQNLVLITAGQSRNWSNQGD